MYKKILFIFVSIYATAAYGQDHVYQAPDYNKIEKNIEVKNSAYYYPDLLLKLQAYDTLLTKEQYKHLYYGFIFQDEHVLFPEFSKEEELTRFYEGKFDKTEHKIFINLLKEAIAENPLHLETIDQLAYAYKIDGQEENYKKVLTVLYGLLDVIISSGDGYDCKSAFHANTIADQYMLLRALNLESLSKEEYKTCDYFIFEKDKYEIPGLYFDNSKRNEITFKRLGLDLP